MRSIPVLLTVFAGLLIAGCDSAEACRQAETQVQRIAHKLDRQTTSTGVYIRVGPNDVREQDPWGTEIDVNYSQGGVAEMVEVRSAGPDRHFYTRDDIVAEKLAANLKGIGEGIRKNAKETASEVASGLVKGTVKGVKEAVMDVTPFRKRKSDSTAEALEAAKPDAAAVNSATD